jgi:D-alanyl-D-alanine-carboxypeptidase/D-alanyl-D-alanine-endopeptidase
MILKLPFVLAFLFAASTHAQQVAPPPFAKADTVEQTLDHAVGRFLAENPQAVGLSIGVIVDGRYHQSTFGRARRDHPGRPTLDTLYPIASISKTFTGALLARAQSEHRLRISDDVRAYLKDTYPNLEFGGKPIRLFDLLDHRSGLPFLLPDTPETRPDYAAGGKSWNERVTDIGKTYGKSDFLADLHTVTLRTEPGASFSYSNAGAQLAGYVLEHVYAQSFEDILRKALRSLHMTNTMITIPPRYASRLAVGYDADGNAVAPVPDWLQGAGAIKSTLGDMLEYTRWQLAETDAVVKLSHQPVFTQGAYSAAAQLADPARGRQTYRLARGQYRGFQQPVHPGAGAWNRGRYPRQRGGSQERARLYGHGE